MSASLPHRDKGKKNTKMLMKNQQCINDDAGSVFKSTWFGGMQCKASCTGKCMVFVVEHSVWV
jgi:hypothetical protein